jgi:hypothetical protein
MAIMVLVLRHKSKASRLACIKFINICAVACIAINPLKPKHVNVIFNNSFCTTKKTKDFAITDVNWLKLFREIIAVYFEDHTKPINTLFLAEGSL